jgi:hypothetical protein
MRHGSNVHFWNPAAKSQRFIFRPGSIEAKITHRDELRTRPAGLPIDPHQPQVFLQRFDGATLPGEFRHAGAELTFYSAGLLV